MAEQRRKKTPWEGEHWSDLSFSAVSIEPNGSVNWPPEWSAADKREYLEDRRETVRNLDPENFDPNGGSLGILEKDVQRAEAEERRVQNSKSPDLARVPLMESRASLME